MSNDLLNADFRHLLTDLTIAARSTAPSPLPEGSPALLLAELERAFEEPDYFDALRSHLVQLKYIPTTVEPLSDSEREQVLARGLADIPAERLARLAVDLVALLDLRDAIVDEMPDYWWARIKRSAQDRGVLRTAQEVFAAALAQARPTAAPALAAFTHLGTEANPDQWSVELPGQDTHAKFTWHRNETPAVLEVELRGKLLLLSSVRCTATLRDASGTVVVQTEAVERRLRFNLPANADLIGWRFEAEYTRGSEPPVPLTATVRSA